MGANESSESIKLNSSTISAETHCLCIGAGVTSKLVGDWYELLGSLLERRFVREWLTNDLQFDKIMPVIGKDCFAEFFSEEGPLELGEFLLADDSAPLPHGLTGAEGIDWKERLFAQQVSDVVDERTKATLCKGCKNDSCIHFSECALAKKDPSRGLLDIFKTCHEFECGCASFGTTMAVVELCLTGKIRYVITYNFDTIVEQTLYEVLNSEKPVMKSEVQQIHIWTYGKVHERKTVHGPSRGCSVEYHQGVEAHDAEAFAAKGSVHFFHVHGVATGPWLPDVDVRLVFSQHSYELFLGSPLNWGNQMLELLCSRYDLLGVGFSGVDVNFRAFAQHHEKAATSAGHHVTLLKAKQPHRKAIGDALEKKTGHKLGTKEREDLTERFLEYRTSMVTSYYRNTYKVDTEWVGTYVDVASWLYKAAYTTKKGVACAGKSK